MSSYSQRTWGSLEKWLSPELGLGKSNMSLEQFIITLITVFWLCENVRHFKKHILMSTTYSPTVQKLYLYIYMYKLYICINYIYTYMCRHICIKIQKIYTYINFLFHLYMKENNKANAINVIIQRIYMKCM